MLVELPLVFVLIGLGFYVLFGGADFGAGLWQLTAGTGPDANRLRDAAHDVLGPVWEANHVWLIFVLTVTWTAYPVLFGSAASTLSVPLFLAGLGLVVRGAAYALYAGARSSRETRRIDTAFSVSSVLTPFALGAAVGGLASGRVPVGNAAGDLWSSWLNPTSITVGLLAVGIAGFLAAVYLCADAGRVRDQALERDVRVRALVSGVLTGALAVAGLVVVSLDAPRLFAGLVHGAGLAALVVSAVAGIVTLPLVWWRRYTPARLSAALAVAAVVAAWALAQRPFALLDRAGGGLTIEQAAAPSVTLLAVTIAVLAGAVLLGPSLGLLFWLVLGGRFDPSRSARSVEPMPDTSEPGGPRRRVTVWAVALLIVGFVLLTVAEVGWAHGLGVVCLVGFVVVGFAAVGPTELSAIERR
jgi:cytochrome bd ubiquinol oxidase subunit II